MKELLSSFIFLILTEISIFLFFPFLISFSSFCFLITLFLSFLFSSILSWNYSKRNILTNYWYWCSDLIFSDIVKQLEKQYDLPLKVEYNSLKGFYIQIPGKAVPQIEKLPSIFLKVNKFKTFITCTTEDLVSI